MRKLIIFIALIFLVTSLGAQEKVIKPITGWSLENGAATDSVTGVAAAAASLDTVYFGIFGEGSVAGGYQYPEIVLIHISTTNVNNQDTLSVQTRSLMRNTLSTSALQTDNLVGQGGIFRIELNSGAAGNDAAVGYGLIFDGTKGADTDTTAYTISGIFGVYNKD